MDKIAQRETPGRPGAVAITFISALRRISAERAEEMAVVQAERDSYRELLQQALASIAELNSAVDRERGSRLWLLAQYRALQSGKAAADPRLSITDAAIVEKAAA